MSGSVANLVFPALSMPVLAVSAAAAAVAWEWLRWGFFHGRTDRRVFRAIVAALLAGPLAVGMWRLFAWSALASLPVLAVVAVAWAFRSYSRTTSEVSRPVKRVLLGVRIAIILLAVLIAACPTLEHTFSVAVRQAVAILVDTSESMTRTDSPAEYTDPPPEPGEPGIEREQSVRQALADQADRLNELSRRYDVRLFGFDADLAALPADGPQPLGQATAIGDSLQRVIEQFEGDASRLAGICVLTDGCNNTADLVEPVAQAEVLAARRVALWTVGVGSEEVHRAAALNVRRLVAPDQVDVMNRLAIAAEIEGIGLAGQRVRVECRMDDHLIGAETVAFNVAVQTLPVQFATTPTRAGFRRIVVTAVMPEIVGREVVGQNTQAKVVQVLGRFLRVLYVEGRRRYENNYVSRAIASGERFRLERWLMTAPAGGEGGPPRDFEDRLAGYQVIMLGDCPASTFTPAQLETIRRAVDADGRGLLMIGGTDSFGDGGWAGTPLADALPVDLAASRGSISDPLKVVPTEAGLATDPMKIVPDGDPRAAWESLRPLKGANRIVPKTAAQVLAETPAGQPLIVSQRYGAGRTMAIAFDTTWQWVLSPDDTGELQKRFWRQVMLWLANPLPDAWVTTDQTNYDERRLRSKSATIEVTARIVDSMGRPQPDLPVEIVLAGPGGAATPVVTQPSGPVRKGLLPPLPAGEYTLTMTPLAEVDGRTLAPVSHKFVVERRNLESFDVVADLDLLRRMGKAAEPAGGGYKPLAQLGDVLETFLSGRPVVYERRHEFDPLVDRFRWWLIGLLVAMLAAEWSLRKRKGLV